MLVIPECATKFGITIPTLDDFTLEKIEYFSVRLSHGANGDLDSRIDIPEPERQYEIFDIDGKLVLGSTYLEVLLKPCRVHCIIQESLTDGSRD